MNRMRPRKQIFALRKQCAAGGGCAARGVAEMRKRGQLVRMAECQEHVLCWDCTQRLVRWSVQNNVSYFRCPLCSCEVREVVRDGGGRSVAQFHVRDLGNSQASADKAAAVERRRQQREQRQQQEQAEQLVRKQQIANELGAELGSVVACRALEDMLIRLAKQRAPRPNERIRRADPDFADRYLSMVGPHFPVTAHLCSSDPVDSVLARDLVFSLLER